MRNSRSQISRCQKCAPGQLDALVSGWEQRNKEGKNMLYCHVLAEVKNFGLYGRIQKESVVTVTHTMSRVTEVTVNAQPRRNMSDRYLMRRRKRSSLDRELDSLQIQLQTLCCREVHVQKVLDDIQKLKDEILNERAAVEEKISELEAQKEPINWLPPELLEQVFLAVTEFDLPNSKYRPQVVVSHVCAKWRTISLASSRLWSRINLLGFAKPDSLLTFVKRSGKAPLEIDYRSLAHVSATQECCQMADMIIQTQHHFERVDYLSLQSRVALPLVYILPSINNHKIAFPRLQYLCLSITGPNPSFVEAPSLMESINAPPTDSDSLNEPTPSTSCLSRLKLEQVPLFKFPTPFIANLRSLELSYSPRRMNSTRHDYYLKMSSLCHFLAHTPLLEELVLTNTVPYFDVILATDGTDNPDIPLRRAPVNLDHLKTLEWSYPFAVDIYRFLSLIDTPGLEKLDLWVEDLPTKRNDTLFVRGYTLTSSPHKYSRGIVNYPSVRDLSLQCVGEDTTSSVLRKFSFPALEKLAFTNIDSTVRQNPEITTALPVFPRLESIFRDPRLPSLTHLTLSHFKISAEQGRAEAMLGYLPVLTSLSLDACTGVGRLMEGLQEKVVGTIKPLASPGEGGGKRRRRGVKVCPRLEALSFWGCQDVDFGALRAVVLSRNRSNNDSGDEADVQTGVDVPKGAIQSITREDQSGSDHKTEEAKMGRKIKPLRKLRRFGHEPSTLGAMNPSTNILSTFNAIQESFQPASIVYLRVANCKLIEEKEASSLRDLGVGDVIWAGSDSA